MSDSPRRAGILRIGLVVLAVAGTIVSGALAVMSTPQSEASLPGISRLCVATERVDCNHVLRSSYARIRSVPVASLGFAYFAFLTLWYAAIGVPNPRGRAWHWLPVAITTIGAGFSAWFIYVMAARLPVWCTWCVAAHAVNAPLWLLTLIAIPRRSSETRLAKPAGAPGAPAFTEPPAYPSLTRALGVLGGAAAVALLAAALLFALQWQRASAFYQRAFLDATNNAAYIRWQYDRQPQVEVPVLAEDLSIGLTDAPHTLVAFIDFECPHCQMLYGNLPSMATLFPGAVRFVFKHFPLSRSCNPDLRSTLHQYACEAAFAAEAARAAGSGKQCQDFWRLLFRNADRLATRPYADLADQAGIDRAAFARALAEGAGRDRVREDIAVATKLGVTGSGQMFLDGRRLSVWYVAPLDGGLRMDHARTIELWEALLGMKAQRPTTGRVSPGS